MRNLHDSHTLYTVLFYGTDARSELVRKEESTRLADTGLVVELEHLKTKTRFLFFMNKKIENYREDLYMSIGVMTD